MTWLGLLALIVLPLQLPVAAQGPQPNQTYEKSYSIAGKVKRPGPYPLTEPTTVLQAIKNAGGSADSDPVAIVIRHGNTAMIFPRYDPANNSKLESMELKDGDVVTVKPAQRKLDHIRLPSPP